VAAADAPDAGRAPLPAAERRAIRRDLARARREARARELRGRLDGRHVVLAGAVASAIAFGLPAFCLVCPIGLTTAAVLLLARAFGAGDAGWTLLVVPALLVAEVVVFRRWCHALCPLGGLMSLVARGNRTLRPRVDATACVEVTRGATCGACARACPEGIDLRHLDASAGLHECVRCRACVEACPTKAIRIPLRAAAPRARVSG
ncbi:4Fe-4S binding protein, partial [bacterium]|nr:4Fe-4S binding protein [bacterium]